MEDRHYVYKLTFPDGKVYFGSTGSIKSRWRGNGDGYRALPAYEWIQKFGWENVKKEVILYLKNAHSTIMDVERALIKDNEDICLNVACTKRLSEMKKREHANKKSYVLYVWTINGVTKPAADWCREYNVQSSSAVNRVIRYRMSPLEALLAPKVPYGKSCSAEEYYKSVGYEYGKDKTSYVTPLSEWPDEYGFYTFSGCVQSRILKAYEWQTGKKPELPTNDIE